MPHVLQVLFRSLNEAIIVRAEAGSVYKFSIEFKMAAVSSDAATLLAEALQKMDGLISDDQLIMESLKCPPHSCTINDRVISIVEELRAQLVELSHDAKSIDVPESTVAFLFDWLESVQVNKYFTCRYKKIDTCLLSSLMI